MKKFNNKELNLINKIFKDNIFMTLFLIFMIISTVLIALIPPIILKNIIDDISTGKTISLKISAFYFFVLALSGIVDSQKEIIITRFGQRITNVLRACMCEKLNFLSADYFIDNATGKIISYFTCDVDAIQSLFSNGIVSMVIDTFRILSILTVIFFMSFGLGITMLFVLPLVFFMTRVFQKKMIKAQLENRTAVSKAVNHIPETINSIRTIQNLRKQHFMEQKYEEYIDDSYKAIERSNFYDSIYSPIIITLNAVIISFVMIMSSMGGSMQEFFSMSVGTAVAIIAYINKIFAPIENLGMEIQNIQGAIAGIKRVRKFINEKEEEFHNENIDICNISSNEKAVVFEDVGFSYDNTKYIFENVNFSINKGDNIVLTGRTGCGKSTVFKLILGLYKPCTGNINIFGKPAYELSNECKRDLFGYVEQSFHMIEGTVADQITLGDDKISTDMLYYAAKLVGIHDIIINLENGYNTKCSQSLFSQGQFQLLSIARAVVKNPPIMLLDEITANLDSKTEKLVLEALNKAGKDRTVISISHRLTEYQNSKEIKISDS